MNDHSLHALFQNEEYEFNRVEVGIHTLHIKVLPAATTDYDLTGQILWPASRLLADYLARSASETFADRVSCVEIGSGLGLAGLIAAQNISTVLTDHNETVLRVLQANVDANRGEHRVRCELADWEVEDTIRRVRSLSTDGEGYDLVLGADICYGVRALPFIFRAYSLLLSTQPHAFGLLAYVSRAAVIDRGLATNAHAAGLALEEIQGTRKGVEGGLEGVIYKLKRLPTDRKRRVLSGRTTVLALICAAVLLRIAVGSR